MARPVGADSVVTQKAIVDAAAKLFARRGYEGTTMRGISRACGFSLATLHHHFGNKEGLYRACVDSVYDAFDVLRDELVESWSQGQAPLEVIDALVRRSYRFARANTDAVLLSTREALEAGLDPERKARLLVPGLDQSVALLAHVSSKSERELRLAVRSISYLLVRYALTPAAELEPVVGTDLGAVEDHLVALTHAALGLEG